MTESLASTQKIMHYRRMNEPQRKYATANNPTIEALIHRLYRFPSREKALERFYTIRSTFVLSKEQPESTPEHPAAVLWIKGFEVTEKEAEKGFTGHFARMQLAKTDKGVWTLEAIKVEKPLAGHPQKKRLVSQHPNWGHPVMRAVKKAKRYETIEAANAELELLHSEFSETSIPGQGKLFLIIYEKREGYSKPTHKIVLEVKPHAEGGFTIDWRSNEKPALPKIKPQVLEGETAPATSPLPTDAKAKTGKFASMVVARKNRRRKNMGRPVTGMKPKDDAV